MCPTSYSEKKSRQKRGLRIYKDTWSFAIGVQLYPRLKRNSVCLAYTSNKRAEPPSNVSHIAAKRVMFFIRGTEIGPGFPQ